MGYSIIVEEYIYSYFIAIAIVVEGCLLARDIIVE
jgi:hypothetical protein